MRIVVEQVDIRPWRQSSKLPELPVPLEQGRQYMVQTTPGTPDQPPQWAMYRTGDLVAVPLLPYLSGSRELHDLVTNALIMGLSAVSRHPIDSNTELHMLVGCPVEEVDADQYRFWLGTMLVD